MTFNAIEYLRHYLPADEASRVAGTLPDFAALVDWLEMHQQAKFNPAPNYIPVIPPGFELSWKKNLRSRFNAGRKAGKRVGKAPEWMKVVEYRRRVALFLTLISTLTILVLSYATLRAQRMPGVTLWLYLGIYAVMTYFLTGSFFKLVLGTWHTLRGAKANPWHPTHTASDPRPDVRVAILFPVYHEDVSRVTAGMAATWESIQRYDPEMAMRFDCYMLSDSRKTAYWIAEQAAVYHLSTAIPQARFFYRRRASNLNAKMGNIADFCRRWGSNYEYLLVMDADSIMDGEAVVSLLRMMEGNDRLGILQTNPKPILRTSLFGRMQQFSARLYGVVFAYSLQAMYMGHASYIGHNAMIRTQAFIKHCMLPYLPGLTPWGGKPLSHDIVESALMSRAGYEVWFLPDLEGSYEEIPANILSFLIRERRWMQGNLQHLRLLFMGGLQNIYRETFLNGSMGYLSAPLWACFLIVSAYGMIHFLGTGLLAVGNMTTMAVPVTMLLVSSVVFLFMPRILALAVHIDSRRAKLYGGKDKLIWSMLIETIFSFFFSPIMMIYITKFVWLWIKRKSISWGTQQRDDSALSWSDCLKYFGWVSLVGIVAWAAMDYQVDQVNSASRVILQTFAGKWVKPSDIMLWFFPILGGFTFSVVIARVTSKTFPSLLRRKLFLIPEEISPPEVALRMHDWESDLRAMVPDQEDTETAIRFAMTSKNFFIRHRPETRRRQHVKLWLLPRIQAKQKLTEHEYRIALSERSCFDELHAQNSAPKAP